jgi:hypothetical protein
MANPVTRLVKNKSSIKHFTSIFYEQHPIKQKIIIFLRNKICSNLLNALMDLLHVMQVWNFSL